MLVLSRSADESIVIGDDIRVIVLSVRGKQVRLGIDAPKDVIVNREEIHRNIKDSPESTDIIAPSTTRD